MTIFGVRLIRPSFDLMTRAVACATAVWVAVVFVAQSLGWSAEPATILCPLLIGSLLFAIGIDVFRNARHLAVGLSLYVALNMLVETLVLPLL